MDSVKEITVYTVGDALELKTWSNVPYFFTKTLEAQGHKVNRVNIEENALLNVLYKYSVFALLKLLYRNSNHTYFRSRLHHLLTRRKINLALKKHRASHSHIFLTFSFSTREVKQPVALFGDWTYLYYIRHFLNREPYWFEKGALKREENNIRSASLVLGLFPLSAAFIKTHYPGANCHYLGNVINANYPLRADSIPGQKIQGRHLLFIGNQKYLEGARQLIEAFRLVVKSCPDAVLDMVGLSVSQTGVAFPGLRYHGYLNKGLPAENETYYRLILQARGIVNTNPGWGAFSALTEAMYYYTPVVTSPYGEFTETYGHTIDFGYYTDGTTPELARLLIQLLKAPSEELIRLMNNAHGAVKEFTWDNYTKKLLDLIPLSKF